MSAQTTNEAMRERYRADRPLADGNVETVAPDNAADAVVPKDADVVLVTCDGTNTVDLDNAADEGREVTVVHNGGATTPTVEFADADFVGTGPADMTSEGATATLRNVDGTTSGWVVKSTGSA